jgi:hypothetical protein
VTQEIELPVVVEESGPAAYLGTDTRPIIIGPVTTVPLLELEAPKKRRTRPKHLGPLLKVNRDVNDMSPRPVSAREHLGNVDVPMRWAVDPVQKKLAVAAGFLAVNAVLFAAWAMVFLGTL